MGAETHAWHTRLKADTADYGHGCNNEGMTSPRLSESHSVNTDLHSAEVLPTPPLQCYPAASCLYLPRVDGLKAFPCWAFGSCKPTAQIQLNYKRGFSFFLPHGHSLTEKSPSTSMPLCMRLCFPGGAEGTVKLEAALDCA